MIIGVLSLEVSIFDAMTLKDKRRVIKSLKDRLGNTFNVSVAEVGYNDSIKTSLLAVAMVANDSRFIDSALSKIVDFVRKTHTLSLEDYTIEKF
ncbi:MAG: DUF503 domain-containing protein [Phycisphaerae bacterium]|nr:DUF503 domain-containing protein [Phycisphaerae bacterium]